MQTIGLIGGASWESTADYYRIINERVRQRDGGLSSPTLLLHSFNSEEMLRLQQQGEWTKAAAQLTRAAASLYDADARCLGICTTALHRVAPEVQAALPADALLLHIGDSVGMAVRQAGLRRIALLDTAHVMEGLFFSDFLYRRHDIQTVVPCRSYRERIHETIFEQIRRDAPDSETRRLLKEVALSLKETQGAGGIVFGNASLSNIADREGHAFPLPRFDATLLHARAIADHVLFHPSAAYEHPLRPREIDELVGNIY